LHSFRGGDASKFSRHTAVEVCTKNLSENSNLTI
jgi:hypothetical protein